MPGSARNIHPGNCLTVERIIEAQYSGDFLKNDITKHCKTFIVPVEKKVQRLPVN
jgi:hypothetical protein